MIATPTASEPLANNHAFLRDGGRMGEYIASKDWSATPLGAIENWPQSLRTTVSLCLASNFPMSLAWGAECTQIYNDGYWPICAAKHPDSMGQDFRACWASAWPAIGEAFEGAKNGHTRFLENQRMFLDRHGYLEETFFTFSFSPIRDESGRIGGLFHPVTETSTTMLGERRTNALRDLASKTTHAASVDQVCRNAMEVLSNCPFDLPFVLLYLLDDEGKYLRLAGCVGIQADIPNAVVAAKENIVWPFHSVITSGESQVVERVAETIGHCGPYPEAVQRALVAPIVRPGLNRLAGVLIAGISPRLRFDETYRSFQEMVGAQFATAVSAARAYEEERRRTEALAEIDQAKTVFFSNISHEFRTPLTLMLGPLEDMLAQAGQGIQTTREDVSLVHRNGLRLLRLVNALLDFSRIEAGRMQAEFQPVDLAELTSELVSNFRAATDKAGLRLTVDCAPLRELVFVDLSMWEKVVLNLISNAFKFTLQGEITVTLTQRGERAELAVKDTGTGISPDDLPHLFERFYQVKSAKGRTQEGTGIGLSLVQELTKLHAGRVDVRSEMGVGTAFTVSIPFGSAHLPPNQIIAHSAAGTGVSRTSAFVEEALRWIPEHVADKQAEPQPDSVLKTQRRGKILLADDNMDMRLYIQRLLSKDFEVEAVDNGLAALEAAQSSRPDLVLSDVMMPKLDGFGLLSALRKDPRTQTVPVVLLSARAGEEAYLEGMAAGADDYLTKPFGARELLARVTANVELSKLRAELVRSEEHKLGVAEMERQWSMFDTVLSSTADHMYQFDRNGRFIYVNRSVLVLWRKTLDDVAGKTLFELDFPPAMAENVHNSLQEVLVCGQSRTQEVEFLSPLGAKLSFEYTLTPVFGKDGGVESVGGASHEITARKRAEEMVLESNRSLQQANRELEEFAYIASHDLREPLRMVTIYSQLLVRDFMSDNPEAKEYVALVKEGVTRMQDLLNGVLSFSRVLHSDGLPAGEPADLSLAWLEAKRVLSDLIAESEADVTASALPKVFGDQTQLVQVFQNLLANAIKYRHLQRKPVIRVSAESKGGNCVVSIEDNGIGFHPQYAKRIFGLFKRLHTDRYPGTGLGLAICQRIVERYGGRMWADGRLGEGSTFYFELRLAED